MKGHSGINIILTNLIRKRRQAKPRVIVYVNTGTFWMLYP